jgi:hypothetical protein
MKKPDVPLKDILAAIDLDAKNVWDELTVEERKSVNFWTLTRYVSSITGPRVEVENAVLRTNKIYNKHWNTLGVKTHPKLFWQLLCMSGGTKKIETHVWIGLQSKKDPKNKYVNLILKLYPTMKYDDAELLIKISSKQELNQLIESHGQEISDK